MEAVGMLGMLGICSYEDIKRKRVHVFIVLLFGILGVIVHLFCKNLSLTQMLGGMAVGGVLFAVSIISREKIGKGDALLVTVAGIYLGFWNTLMLLWIASLLAGVVSLVLIARGKRNALIPFIPFLFASYIIILLFKGGTIVS